MGRQGISAAILLAALPAAASAQYETLVNPPDPRAQLAEQLDIYDAICLRAFPDDAAVDQAMTARGAIALTPQQVRTHLHDDPGRGWTIQGRTGRFTVTVENPPFHACGVRTMTVAGYADMAPYRALADRFEAGGGFTPIPSISREIDNLTVTGAGEGRQGGPKGSETLLVVLTTPSPSTRDAGHNAVEVRFVHQAR
jgi:hypothetical protein